MNARDVNKRIEQLGGKQVRQRGSHRMYAATGVVDGRTVNAQTVVPQHAGDIPVGTLRNIERAMEPVFGKGWLR